MIKERTELATPHLSGLLDFWLTKRVGDKPPISSTIAPADLRPWKDNIVIFEVIGEDDFVYSYYGKALAAAFGHSRLGATLDELPEEQRAILRPEYASVLRERMPVARVYTADFGGTTRSWERLALPMSSDGDLIDKILVAAYELTPDDRIGDDRIGDHPIADDRIVEEPIVEEPAGEDDAPGDDTPENDTAGEAVAADGDDAEPELVVTDEDVEPDTAEMDDAGWPAAAEDDAAPVDTDLDGAENGDQDGTDDGHDASDDEDPARPNSTDLKPGAPA
ncbi:PAS domain-containing protein [Azospirillum rugosum]|uniref:PAS fold-4 domain-containing protein n=1 Tax=Azospirillum rugosum TaxID=416170 RepID=A0ABS4SSC3_9PROT|nr:PAS domain-containing protein [Azospirillum rugosum]MBP2295129.1 hypothetical protein [Azospirillum rugosum]MDQ0528503.1 hypothetical protein [Azospirillum rugosum]